jgi:hypothetical protein
MSDVKRRKLTAGASERQRAPVKEPKTPAKPAAPEKEEESASEEESATLDVPSEDKSAEPETPKTFADLVLLSPS